VRQSSRTDSVNVTDFKDVALVFALLLPMLNVKKREKFWVRPITSQMLLKRKFYSLYEGLKAKPQKILGCFRLYSAANDKLMVLLGPSRIFQDTRMRKSVPPED